MEIDDDQEIDQQDGDKETATEFDKGIVHDFGLAVDFNFRTRAAAPLSYFPRSAEHPLTRRQDPVPPRTPKRRSSAGDSGASPTPGVPINERLVRLPSNCRHRSAAPPSCLTDFWSDRDRLEIFDARQLWLRGIDIQPIRLLRRAVKPIFLIDLLAAGGCQEHIEAEVSLVQIHAERESPIAFD